MHPGARKAKVEERDGEWHLWVQAPPVDGKANDAVLERLSELFGAPKSAIRLVSGASSRTKIFELQGIHERPSQT